MSLSKRLIAAGMRDAPHPLAAWKSEAEWRRAGPAPIEEAHAEAVQQSNRRAARHLARGRWLNAIGIDVRQFADPGFEITPAKAPGMVKIGARSFTHAVWTPDPETPPRPAEAAAAAPRQLELF
jgi:hypothetical protein